MEQDSGGVSPTREIAEQVARTMGCSGAHKTRDGWAPCESHAEMIALIRLGKDGYETWKQRREGVQPRRIIVQQGLAAEMGRRTRRFEPLTERGIRGIDTLPGGGLVSKSLKDALRGTISSPENSQSFPQD